MQRSAEKSYGKWDSLTTAAQGAFLDRVPAAYYDRGRNPRTFPMDPSSSSGADLYVSGEYAERNPGYHTDDSPWKARQILRMLERHSLRPAAVCEVGCGAGEVLHQLQQHLPPGTRLHGYDVSPQAIALCRQRESEHLAFTCAGLPPAAEGPFDLLLCIDVFEHVEDYRGFLRDLRTVAGRVLFHIPLDLSVQTVLRAWPINEARARSGHLHYFTKDTALQALRDTGYQVEDWFYTAGGVDLGRSWKARLAKWPRAALAKVQPDLAARLLGGYSLLVLAK